MSDYNLKITDYAIQPNSAIPLDGRSHFSNFSEAIKSVKEGKVATVEDAQTLVNINARWYIGQIITTTTNGTYEVCTCYDAHFYVTDSEDGKTKNVY